MATLDDTADTTFPTIEQSDSDSSIAKQSVLVLCLLLALITYFGFQVHRSFFHDDAYITLRYANHWQAGVGPVWNSNERVEGYTSFLHLATLTPLQKFGLQPEVSARIVGLCSYLAIWLTIGYYSYKTESNQNRKLMTMLILMSTIPTAFTTIAWSLGGLETPLYMLFLMLATYLFTTFEQNIANSKAITVGLLLAFCTLTRPEAALFVAITIAAALVLHKSLKTSLCILLAFSILYIPYFVWRWSYYGDIFPNTYYVKIGTPFYKRITDGFYYLHTFLRAPPWIPVLALASWCYTLFKQSARCTSSWKYMTAISLTATIYVIWTGGDHMPAYRFWAPIIPIYAWFIVHAWSSQADIPKFKQSALIPAILIFLSLIQFIVTDERMQNARHPDPAAAIGKQVGNYISEHFPPQSVIATNSAGAVAYFAPDHYFIDMLGLNDRTIAKRAEFPIRTHWQQFPGHSKGDGKYILLRNPDYIILGPAEGTVAKTTNQNHSEMVWFLSDQEISEEPIFFNDYSLTTAQLSKTLTFTYYRRKKLTTHP
tara:strand:+ start:5680 stop:7302 length:1623 start_codon:yes stop_codon:yes gene_type:complete